MPLRRTQLTISDLIIRLRTIPNPDYTAVFVSDEPGDIHVAGSVFHQHLPSLGIGILSHQKPRHLPSLHVLQTSRSLSRPKRTLSSYQQTPVSANRNKRSLCRRPKTDRKTRLLPFLAKAPHPHTMRNKEGTYVTDSNDAFAFTPSAALRSTLNKRYPNARDTHRGALHCLELAASKNGWKRPDQNPPQLNHNQAHVITMQIMKTAHNFACNMTPDDWKIVVENYPETISPETTNQESQQHV